MSVVEIHANVDNQIFEKFKQTVSTRHVTNKHVLFHLEQAMKIWIEKQRL